ncbi:cell division protein FtsI (penicillin-binding protein 3) [Pustulibacterium marinum]|uniref:Cell division protein FtsI (Penicillin-binding protein 3) n=1 Tax=Pustulibacterium marinum TaxID=1224947 RepID=A0A1I7GLX1_9FLAO|nr:penicillin-binding protein [Pustulibacterium marinum]SFU49437.1 cell division protein FtsI (penicillin-binding protein 3) [Pustulibacterium marinum]
MAVTDKSIVNRLYVVAGCMFLLAMAVFVKLIVIQTVDGAKYRELAEQRTVKNFTIQPNKGNLYSDDGSLLATSVTRYDVHFDAVTSSNANFEKHVKALSDSLGKMLGKNSAGLQQRLRKARRNKNRYYLIARNLSYSEYMRLKNFPLFNLGAYKGGVITEQRTVREYPLGSIAKRSIGYYRMTSDGVVKPVGLEQSCAAYLDGEVGHRWKQKIAKGLWKPINDNNEVEPRDGYDVISTIDIGIQDIAHHALLEQLEKYKADHGSVVVMEVATGEIKAISNLGRSSDGSYYEKKNYAVGEAHEPGSTFKLMAVTAALEEKVVDTSYMVDTEKGVIKYYGKSVRDSHHGGYGKISLAEAFQVSSNTGIVKTIHEKFSDDPKRFVNRLDAMNVAQPLGLSIKGEGTPRIPHPGDKYWSGIALEWMAFGYGVKITPLQTLTFYNAIANNGEMVKPRLIKEVKEWNKSVSKFDKEVINPKICSQETVDKVKQLLKDVVEKDHGTGHRLYSPNFSMAGKTGTCQKDYRDKSKLNYISSFAGFFPADNPKYSCIVVIHEPDKSIGYYGADVSGPVFKKVAQKIYTSSPLIDTIDDLNKVNEETLANYEDYYKKAQTEYKTIPNVKGMVGMDAISILENLGLQVEVKGNGKVANQSVQAGEMIQSNKKIVLTLS